MSKEKLVPKLRFEEFDNIGMWKQHDFNELYMVSSGYAFNYQDYCDYGINLINGASIEHGKIDTNNMNYLPEDFLNQYSKFILKENDIVLGLNRPIINGKLKISKIPIELHNSLLYQRAGKINYIADIDSDFSFILLSKEILKYTLNEAVGSDQPFISTSKLNKWKIIIPKETEEQNKIGFFFRKIDKMIQLQQSKVNKLKDIKSAYLSEMFPKEGEKYPKKRFEGFTEPWKEYNLNKIGEIIGGNSWSSNKYDKNGSHLVITISNIGGDYLVDVNEGNRITPNNNKYVLSKGDILISMTGNVGRVSQMPKITSVLNQRVGKLIIDKGTDKEFIFTLLQDKKFEKDMILKGQGAAQLNISRTDILDYRFTMPEYNEQKKIGDLFNNINNRIFIEEEKLAKLEKLKQGYLNDMFV